MGQCRKTTRVHHFKRESSRVQQRPIETDEYRGLLQHPASARGGHAHSHATLDAVALEMNQRPRATLSFANPSARKPPFATGEERSRGEVGNSVLEHDNPGEVSDVASVSRHERTTMSHAARCYRRQVVACKPRLRRLSGLLWSFTWSRRRRISRSGNPQIDPRIMDSMCYTCRYL